MPKFFVTPQQINENTIEIQGEDVKHISSVLRYAVGDKITICDGRGMDYWCIISTIEKDQIMVEILSQKKSNTEPQTKITLIQALPKKDKMDWIIQKSVELGVNSIIPFESERTIVKIKSDKKEKRLQRWNKIAEAAAKQSGRGLIPEVQPVHSFDQIVEQVHQYDRVIICYENEENNTIYSLKKKIQIGMKIGIVIGSEGGFTEEEIIKGTDHHMISISVGKRILRTETAGIAVLSMILYELQEV